jgi:RNA polymerase sigma-70 factor (ECF subfamily)
VISTAPREDRTASTRELRAASLGDHIDRLYGAAWALCGSREDAEDLVQETFARVLAKPRRMQSDDPLPYLLRVLRNTFVSSLRTRSRRPQTGPLADDEPCAAAPASAASASPTMALEAREVFAAIAALPASYRDVLVAVDVAGLGYEEAAAALDIPVGTVMSRLYRARGKVADALGR